jgi:orotidine-5'-phosphate decarboxylase
MNPIYVAIDTSDIDHAKQIMDDVRDHVGGVKIGLSLLYACLRSNVWVPHLVGEMDWFCDAKLYDIPTQVAGAIRSIIPLGPKYITLHIGEMNHTDGEGLKQEEMMMRTAVETVHTEAVKQCLPRPRLLGVTTLTHIPAAPEQIALKACRGMILGLDGVVCSPLELKTLRRELKGWWPILATPGIRSDDSPVTEDEQKRTATAKQAMADGADILVIGRPIIQARDRGDAARRILGSLS